MAANSINSPFPIVTDIDGQPLEGGYIWIGVAGLDPQTNPQNAYWDSALAALATQPIRTIGGYPIRSGAPGRMYVNGDFSIRVMNKNGTIVYSSLYNTNRITSDQVGFTGPDGLAYLVSDLADSVSLLKGDALLAVKQPYGGAVARTQHAKNADTLSILDFGAVSGGVTDCTAAIQAAIDALPAGGGKVYIPRGLYLVDPAVSIFVKTGVHLYGDSRLSSQLICKPIGGTVIRRQFNNLSSNTYVNGVVLSDFGIIFRHPGTADPTNYYQVAIQFRHITRSFCSDLYIGNCTLGASSAITFPASQIDQSQGYGISIGSTNASDIAYCGGEGNQIRRVMCAGVRKGITIDDVLFDTPSGQSAAYATIVDGCEVTAAEIGIAQYRQYGALCTISNNIIQAITKMRGSSETSVDIRLEGYDHTVFGNYTESPNNDYELYLGSTSKRNKITWNTNSRTIEDLGSGNLISYSNITTNKLLFLMDNKRDQTKAWARAWAVWYWDGSAIVITDSFNVSGVVRIGVGDYRIDFQAGIMIDANYAGVANGKVNASGDAGLCVFYSSKSVSNCRVLTYSMKTGPVQADFLENSAVFFGAH